MNRILIRPFMLCAVLTLLAAMPPGAAAQQTTITGRVTDAASGQPIPGAQVSIVGTQIGTQTNSAGNYTIRSVTPGPLSVRVLIIGYSEQQKQVTVTAGQPSTLDFELATSAVELSPIVTTATGEQRRVEVGNAIAQVDAAEVVADARGLERRRPAHVARGRRHGRSAARRRAPASRVRIRGTSSLSLTQQPDLRHRRHPRRGHDRFVDA